MLPIVYDIEIIIIITEYTDSRGIKALLHMLLVSVLSKLHTTIPVKSII